MAVTTYGTGHPNMEPLQASGQVLLSLAVPDGIYAIFGKMNLDNDSPHVNTVTCKLIAGERVPNGPFVQSTVLEDVNSIRLAASGKQNVDNASLSFLLDQIFRGSERERQNCIQIVCTTSPPGANVAAGRAKITAIKVDSVGKSSFCK